MGEIFYKRIILFILVLVSLFLILGILENLNARNNSFTVNNVEIKEGNAISGFAAHPLYGNFSVAESGFSYEGSGGVVSVFDDIVYKTGYYSVNGSAWQSFSLSGSLYGSSSVWLKGSALRTLPSFGEGEHYVIVYTCSYNNGWDCHGNKWQLIEINNEHENNGSFSQSFIKDVHASTYDTELNTFPELTVDNDLDPSSRWSGEGDGAWIKYEFYNNIPLNQIDILFYNGNSRVARFSLEYSINNVSWVKMGDFSSSGYSSDFESFKFTNITAKYFRIIGHGNTEPGKESWNSIIEVKFINSTGSGIIPPKSSTGKTYYVATNGDDNRGDGSLDKPWATWQKGFNSIAQGDTLYIRGGTYYPTGEYIYYANSPKYSGVIVNNKDGTSEKPYNVFAYPGETPILDCRNLRQASSHFGILIYNSDYWHLKGLTVTRADQTAASQGGSGIVNYASRNNIFENCVAHHNGGPGFLCQVQSDGTKYINCDAYSNYDSYTGGEDADGFDIGFGYGDPVITLTGCRAWDNADDGFDMYQMQGYSGIYHLNNCWAWHNGYIPGTETAAGNGCGFKYGDDYQSYDGVTRRVSYNCIAYDNRERGFSQESSNVKKEFYNCISYKNEGWGWSFWNLDIPDILYNNIAFGDGIEQLGSRRISSHNSWDGGVTVNSDDFVSVDGSQLAKQRKEDGSLPDIDFLRLKPTSDLIDKGIYTGKSYLGKAPDLGAFEVK